MERIILKILFGSVIPIASSLVCWWVAVPVADSETIVASVAILGLVAGIVVELLWGLSKRYDVFDIPLRIALAVYIFYCFGMFGFFMGVPVFHLILGGAVGYYCPRRRMESADGNSMPNLKKISTVSATAMAGVCLMSAIFALSSDSTQFDLKNMLHLQFNISMPMLWLLVIIGGIGLVVLHYNITQFVYKKTISDQPK